MQVVMYFLSFLYSEKPIASATSKRPSTPIVVLTTNLPVFWLASLKSPWRILLGIVTRFDKLFRELLTPFLTGDGSIL